MAGGGPPSIAVHDDGDMRGRRLDGPGLGSSRHDGVG